MPVKVGDQLFYYVYAACTSLTLSACAEGYSTHAVIHSKEWPRHIFVLKATQYNGLCT